MKNTIETVLDRYPETTSDEWRQIGGAWIHKNASVSEKCVFPEISTAILRRGSFYGGDFSGGYFRGGLWKQSPLQIQGGKHLIVFAEDGWIYIGCQRLKIEDWRKKAKALGRGNGYTDEETAWYLQAIEWGATMAYQPDMVKEEDAA
jgi:hypothetical protein